MNILTLVLFVVGIVLLVGGAELLVRGASKLALAAGISPLVVGLTVVAYGTSAPELAVSVQSSFLGQPDIAIGNVVGSNIANVLLILGLSALVVPLVVSLQLIRFDVPLMIGASVVLLLLGLDGQLGRLDGALLFGGAVVYSVWLIRQSRKESRALASASPDPTPAEAPARFAWVGSLALVVVGLGLLVLGSRWLVDGAIAFARLFGVSELIIGLTVVAVGTSLPEIATSVIASVRGERDIAVGNVVGSNIFNILSVLGLASMVAPAGVPVSPSALSFDMPVMIVVALACLPIFFTGHRIDRWEGGLFLFYYVAYTAYLILRDTGNNLLPLFNDFLLFFAFPLTIVTLAVITVHALRARPNRAG